jgi:hypothetical protein
MTSRKTNVVAAAIGLLAVGVRLPSVYTQPFWQDEVASARILSEPTLIGMLKHVARTESTPPLWYFVGWLLHHGGAPLRDVRLLSVAAGGVLAALVVVLARRFVSLRLAATAGVLVALGGEYVARGQELRAYEFLALFAVLLALCLLAELRLPSIKHELALGGTVAAGGLTHYFFAFSALAALVWLSVDRDARAIRLKASLAIAGGGLVAAGWAPVMLRQYHQDRFWWIGPFRLRYVWSVPLRLFTSAYDNTTLGAALSSLVIAGILLGALTLGRRSPEGRLVAALAILPIAFAGVVWACGVDVFALRNLIAAGPFVAIATAAALSRLPRRAAPAAAAALCIALAVSLDVSTANRFPRFDAIAHSLVRDGWHPSDPIAVFGSVFTYRSPLEWYLPHRPTLDAAAASARDCTELFVLSRSGSIRRLRPDESREADAGLRGATLLIDPAQRPACRRARGSSRRFAA